MAFQFDLEQVDHLLTTTRAVRKRLDLTRPVPRELINECLELAIQAPTGGNTQRWRFVVVDDPEKKLALAEMYRKGWKPYLEASKKTREDQGLEPETMVSESADYLADHFHEAPAMLIPCLLDRGDGPGYWGSVLPATMPWTPSFLASRPSVRGRPPEATPMVTLSQSAWLGSTLSAHLPT